MAADHGRKLRIGSVELENNLLLGPMAGVTDLVFRMLCEEQGCGAVYTEMVSAKALFYHREAFRKFIRGGYETMSRPGSEWKGADKSLGLMRITRGEVPVALQLFGADPEILAEIAAIAQEGAYAWIDINMGCPVPKIVNNGEGSALMKDRKKAEAIVKAVVRHVCRPVTVKLRASFDGTGPDAAEFAKMAEASGAAAVAVHARTRQQFYSGKADWEVIRRVKEAVKIPVIGNGDVFTARDAERMLAETGCDGVMVARGARGNPWIFQEILRYFETGEEISRPGGGEICDMILRHAALLSADIGEYAAVREMRGHIAWYTAGLPYSSQLRNAANQVKSYGELEDLLRDFRDKIHS